MRRRETAKRRAKWERIRPRVLARQAAYREVAAQGVGVRNAKYAASVAPPFNQCADCARLHALAGHYGCPFVGASGALQPSGSRS